jgi:hypothetical protein
MPVKALWFDGRPNMLVSSDQNTLMQREKGRVAGDVSISLGFNSHPRLQGHVALPPNDGLIFLPPLGFCVSCIFGSKYDCFLFTLTLESKPNVRALGLFFASTHKEVFFASSSRNSVEKGPIQGLFAYSVIVMR